ncbi:PEP phosphonomutase-like protein [Amniculicola lignicola CBS 123094]|uniref:PEP phosphonomutase-like protein n=1 Tax=Amniculicola lignicola CBS 123094 TaxID=1392246 RepID=A0A6A5W6L8_9PLEO|nr:PEP phosphonomutase-like protein [Amniculicola lignicola CBS 123094]
MSYANNDVAKSFKALHVPGDPIILTNVWDCISARAIGALPSAKAMATASYAVAEASGVPDSELTLETNITAIRGISRIARELKKPLTVDFQDGFGDNLEEGIREVIKLGVVGINLEDYGRELLDGKGDLYSIEQAQDRIRRVMKVAVEEGVPDFCINARTDTLVVGRALSEAIERGKAYLEAGANTVFVWGGKERGGTSRAEVEALCKAFGGRLNVSLVKIRPGGLTVKELSDIGVARMSIGPQLMLKSQAFVAQEAEKILSGEL